MSSQRYTDLVVHGIALDTDNQLPIVLLTEPVKNRTFPVQIGPFEASAIIMELEGIRPPRPLTHDLFASFFSRHKFTMTCLTITGVENGRVSASITYRRFFRSYTMDVRPSDGLALAIRLGAQIRCETGALDRGAADEPFMSNLIPFMPDEPIVQH